jgi:serine/threonine protein kinase
MINLGHSFPDRENTNDNSDVTQQSTRKILGGRYQVLLELGNDGCSKTYLVEDLKSSDRIRCVVKHFYCKPKDERAWQDLKNYLERELIVLKRLGTHEQIPRFLDYFTEDRQIYLVLEYIAGINIKQEINNQHLEENQLIILLFEVLKILDFVHRSNVIHCNINPSNLIARKPDGKIFLVNFEFFQEIENSTYARKQNSKNSDNIDYIAPEQSLDRATFASDIYALGRTAIYALTGKSPSKLEKETSQWTNWQNYCQISQQFAVILIKMTSPQLTERYQSASEVLYDLQPLLLIDRVLLGRYKIRTYLGGKPGIYTYLADNFWQRERSPCILKQINLSSVNANVRGDADFSLAKTSEICEKLNKCSRLPKILDLFEQNHKFYLVREYIEGTSLKQQLKQQHRFSKIKVILLLQDVLEILDNIHKQGIIHQNIHPSNLIVRATDGKVVLIDVGITPEIVSHLKKVILSSEAKAYMPPEQLAGRATFSSDIYALGMSAIEALTGISPQQLTRSETGEIIWRSQWQVDSKLMKILNRMVSQDLSKRDRSAKKVLENVKAIVSLADRNIQSNGERTSIREWMSIGSTTIASKKPRHFNWLNRSNLKVLTTILIGAIVLALVRELFVPTLRPIYHIYQAESLIEKQPQKALEKFQSVIDISPNHAKAWKGRGDSLTRLGRWREALSAYDEAIRLNPKDGQAWQGKGNTHFNLEEFTAAIAAYDKALEQKSDDSESLQKKGKALVKLERYPEALNVQQEVINLDPSNAEAFSNLGIALIGLRRYPEALIAFDKAQTIQPQQPQLWQDKGLALEYLGRPQAVEKAYKEALIVYESKLKTDPKDLNSWIEQGNLLTRLKLYKEALNSYHKALAIDPNVFAIWKGKGNAFLGLGNTKKALEAFERALELVPNSYYTWRDRGLALSQENRYSEALASFDKAIAANPKDYQSWVAKGMALDSLRRPSEALIAFDKAAKIQPQEPSVWLDRGAVLARWGRYAQACESYQKATDLNPLFSPAIQASEKLNCPVRK